MRIHLTLLSLLLAVAIPQAFSPTTTKEISTSVVGQETMAKVIVYRKQNSGAFAIKPSVFCNEEQLARLDNGYYFTVNIKPGKHTLRSNNKHSGILLEVKSGETYYVRMDMGINSIWSMKATGEMSLIPAEQARFELQRLKPIKADHVKNKTMVSLEEIH